MTSSVSPRWWRDLRIRALLLQALVLAAVLALIGLIVHNTLGNLRQQGISTGFGFLDDPAGFGILFHLIPYSEAASYGRAFLVGLLNTLLVSALAIVIATLLGTILGIARLSPNWLIRQWAAAYIELVRNIPLLLQIFFWYFAVLRALPPPREALALFDAVFVTNRGLYLPKPLPQDGFGWVALAFAAGVLGWLWLRRRRLQTNGATASHRRWPPALLLALPLAAFVLSGAPLGWELPAPGRFNFSGGWTLVPEFVALLTALSLYSAAFIAEIVRAGIQSVPQGQREAALALGLTPQQTLWAVILPQALRVIVPPLTNQYLNLTKNSSLAAAIGYPDLVSIFAGTVLNQTGQAVEVIAITMAVYLTLSLSIAAGMSLFERRRARGQR